MTAREQGTVRVELGDCIEVMAAMPTQSVDAIVTDPPYGISFMGRAWDTFDPASLPARVRRRDGNGPPSDARDGRAKSRTKSAFANGSGEAGAYDFSQKANRAFQAWCEAWAREALRVLKPGGHLLVFGGTRTYHRLAAGVEDAGFEIRDTLCWLYGQGFPKSLDVSKAIDKAAGAEREPGVPGRYTARRPREEVEAVSAYHDGFGDAGSALVTAPVTPDAKRWQGWGTALKPGHEPIVVARKPLAGTVAANVAEHRTGALNIDGCRIGYASAEDLAATKRQNPSRQDLVTTSDVYGADRPQQVVNDSGRWPANVVLDEEAAAQLDEQTGELGVSQGGGRGASTSWAGGPVGAVDRPQGFGDTGGASRFFYVAKADTAERNRGLGGGDLFAPADAPERNDHPTVKPIALMRWLVRLVTPPGGVVLDPFTGSGTTGCAAALEGFSFIGIEREPAYAQIARARLAHWSLGAAA